jgi:hypothetical protein
MLLKAAINHARELVMVRMIVSVDKCQAIHFRYSPERLTIRGVSIDDPHSKRFHGILNKTLRIDNKPTHWEYYLGGPLGIEQCVGVMVS